MAGLTAAAENAVGWRIPGHRQWTVAHTYTQT